MLVVTQIPTRPAAPRKSAAVPATALAGSSMAIELTLKPPNPSTPLVMSVRTALPGTAERECGECPEEVLRAMSMRLSWPTSATNGSSRNPPKTCMLP